ncbi:hypothetical protein AMTRI_Chr03g50090 [Amborella trichopoda]
MPSVYPSTELTLDPPMSTSPALPRSPPTKPYLLPSSPPTALLSPSLFIAYPPQGLPSFYNSSHYHTGRTSPFLLHPLPAFLITSHRPTFSPRISSPLKHLRPAPIFHGTIPPFLFQWRIRKPWPHVRIPFLNFL